MLQIPQTFTPPQTPFNLLPTIAADEVATFFNALEDRARRFDFVCADDLLTEAGAFVAEHLAAYADRHGARTHATITRAIYLARRTRRLEAALNL